MCGSETDYFAWVKTGHFAFVFGVLGLILFGLILIVAISSGSAAAIVIFAIFTGISVVNIGRGAMTLRRRAPSND